MCNTLQRNFSTFPCCISCWQQFLAACEKFVQLWKKRNVYFSLLNNTLHSKTWPSFWFQDGLWSNQQEMPFWSKQISPRNLYNTNFHYTPRRGVFRNNNNLQHQNDSKSKNYNDTMVYIKRERKPKKRP